MKFPTVTVAMRFSPSFSCKSRFLLGSICACISKATGYVTSANNVQCQNPKNNWFCLSCKDVLCGRSFSGHIDKHYQETKHCLCVSCSTKLILCFSCRNFLDAQVIQQLWAKSRSSSAKLESIDAMVVDVTDLLSKPFPTINNLRCNLSEETSAFIKAQDELKVASELSASITQKLFVVRQQTSKYDEVKKEMIASDEKVANYKSTIKELEAQIKGLEACLATEVNNRKKIDEVIDSIETQFTTARDGLVSGLAQVSSMEGTTQAAYQLVTRKQSHWDNLKIMFTRFAIANATMSRHPSVKWAQQLDTLYITIELPDAQDVKLTLEPEGKFLFSATAGAEKTPYVVDLDLYDKIDVNESRYSVGSRNICHLVKKAENKWWSRLIKQEGKAPGFLKVDWDNWEDEQVHE
ncbi:RING finger protein ETP1 homolog [Rosa rugosa]|uniref:RING finger protein ETP1 homolog n=1 Tax=Rosa rugosa TaxID=74645 RepID=UPI002B41581E|nr:RING finger protein ETP1 homolog [Rosa rugosa]